MFSKDFKQHCQAADLLRETIPTAYDSVLAINDLLLRWATLRILEGNTQVLVKLLDMLRELLAAMEDRGDKLSEYECKLILPVLVEKAGHNQDKIKEMFRYVLSVSPHEACKFYDWKQDNLAFCTLSHCELCTCAGNCCAAVLWCIPPSVLPST